MHVFGKIEKLVQLKIVYHKVSTMLYSVQNLKNHAAEVKHFIIGVPCISNSYIECRYVCIAVISINKDSVCTDGFHQ